MERFTRNYNQIMLDIDTVSEQCGEYHISGEHLLLAILGRTDCTAIKVLLALGVSPNQVMAEIKHQLPQLPPRLLAEVDLTPRAQTAIKLANQYRREMGDAGGSEHLLLGLIAEEGGLAARVLTKQGLTIENVREQIRRIRSDQASTV